jgi:two-component system, OmpR family, phosphate regulon response regulator PhoB
MSCVLVIDDEPDVLLLCRVNLQHAGHDVLEAGDGEHGLALAVSELPDAIVLDLMLPAMDGYGVLAALRGDDRTRAIPVLVLTAKAQREDRVRCWEEGAAEYMTKPFSPSVLSSTLEQLLAMSPEQRDERREAMLRKFRDECPASR